MLDLDNIFHRFKIPNEASAAEIPRRVIRTVFYCQKCQKRAVTVRTVPNRNTPGSSATQSILESLHGAKIMNGKQSNRSI